ncbi:MAG: imidazole glycerol phosphate synthase subunit HisH [Oscillospiraceae bacterium]
MLVIIDYGAGNIQSVVNAFQHIGCKSILTASPEIIAQADAVVLPGVGSFGDAMENMRSRGLEQPIKDFISSGKPFLGICLGLQLLFESSEESPGVSGLGILKGKILRIPKAENLKIPHMGWNSLALCGNGAIYRDMQAEPYVYFVHSYYLHAEEDIVTATARYGAEIHASVQKGNVSACQFHPEKSGELGLQLLRNFVLQR